MISIERRTTGTPRVLAVYSFRYDAHLVPAMLANTAPLVDGWVSYDDRGSTADFSDEVHRRLALLEAARDAGADWALAVDPDERFEARLRRVLPSLLEGPATAYTFRLREMYAPRKYRVDGIWGQKRQGRLLDLRGGVVKPEGALHLPWHAFLADPRPVDTDVNLYHLKMITSQRRRARADLYERLDPEHRMQPIGYDYLADETGLVLERIPFGAGYRPSHREDDGLWMAPGEGR